MIFFYLISVLLMIGFFGYVFFREEFDFSLENVMMAVILTTLGPLGLCLILSVNLYLSLQDATRYKCQAIMTRWETSARKTTKESHWDWYNSPKTSETRYNMLRETINCLSDRELKLLLSVSKHTFEIEKPLRDALLDEVIYREISK